MSAYRTIQVLVGGLCVFIAAVLLPAVLYTAIAYAIRHNVLSIGQGAIMLLGCVYLCLQPLFQWAETNE